MMLETRNLTVTRGARTVVDHVSLTVTAGEIVAILGPNGAGKSTFLKAALGLLTDQPATGITGEISIGGDPLRALGPTERARRAAYVPQEREIAWALDVWSVVALGRLPHRSAFAAPGAHDHDAVETALRDTGAAPLAERRATELSGGERARVLIARALAQEAPLLVADEPTSGLDPAHQLSLLELFRAKARDGMAIVLSMHDLHLAARFSDRICLLSEGRAAALGKPTEVLTRANIHAAYGCDAVITETPAGLAFLPVLVDDACCR